MISRIDFDRQVLITGIKVIGNRFRTVETLLVSKRICNIHDKLSYIDLCKSIISGHFALKGNRIDADRFALPVPDDAGQFAFIPDKIANVSKRGI